ncbi:unnamed protein product [Medioppia subpectinata]|uniref:PH domain-containing protein n=1 Tax=Medioppia subpectinata TaxID=1979941 RepID=A0A7R9Q0V9_9ACAR|nr:unnamed protein product [Medioppia subpectinata]CAG2108527.1 unnamed protein product [Medioppia subpectinata]
MRINERTLVAVVHSRQTPVDKSGWLYKRGDLNRSFQKRWCVLKGNLFYYFDKKTDREPLGLIILEGCRLELAELETEKFAFKIDFGGGTGAPDGLYLGANQSAQNSGGQQMRTYILGTDSQQDMESWMKALSCASYDYLKMIVAELQTRLDDINKLQDSRLQRQRDSASGASGSGGHLSARSNPFDTEALDLMDVRPGASIIGQSSADNCIQFTRRAFAEIHEFHGIKFREYIQQNRDKHKPNVI